MMKVYKYPIEPTDYFDLELPVDAKVLTVDFQYNQPCVWALLDTDKPGVLRHFRLAGTGHPITEKCEELEYINTFQMMGGHLVFHLFELKK